MGERPVNPFAGMKRILIRSPNWVGDAVMSLPAVSSVCGKVPEAEVVILAKPWVGDLFREHPGVREVIPYRSPGVHEGVWGRWRLSRELKQGRFDLALHLPNSMESALISFLAGIPRRVGYNTDGRGIFLTHRVPVNGKVKREHQVEYYLHLIRSLGIETAERIPSLQISQGRKQEAEGILKSISGGSGPFVGISPGAQYGSAKEWFPERFGELALRISGEIGARLLILGSAADRAAASRIGEIAGSAVVDLCGKTTLALALALISRCRVFVTNDSGLMHAASALAVPLVAIFGSTDPRRTGPLARDSRVVYRPLPCAPCLKTQCPRKRECMEAITVEEVFREVKELWGLGSK
jgi:heptosyltransferase-2